MTKHWWVGSLLLLIALGGIGLIQSAQTTFLPLINHIPVIPAADEVSARLQVAAGYAVHRYASGLNRPRMMAIGPDGPLYVAERGANRIVRLPDQIW